MSTIIISFSLFAGKAKHGLTIFLGDISEMLV